MLEKLKEMPIDTEFLKAIGFETVQDEYGDSKWLAVNYGNIVEYCNNDYGIVEYHTSDMPYDTEEVEFDIVNMYSEDVEERYPEMEVEYFNDLGHYIEDKISLP